MRLLFCICAMALILGAPSYLRAQDDEVSLGDLARALRNSKPLAENEVIDNDNFDRVMDKAESERLDGQPVFAISHSGTLTSVSADGTCSLSFDSREVNRTSAAYISTDLPQIELVNLEGPAAIEGSTLEVSIHNGTQWELKELVVGLTVTQTQPAPAEYRFATLQSAPVVSSEKLPEPTILYHLRGSAAPNSTTIFSASIADSSEAINNGKDWHWSIVGARGVPPAAQTLEAAHDSMVSPAISSPSPGSQPVLPEPSALSSESNSGSAAVSPNNSQH